MGLDMYLYKEKACGENVADKILELSDYGERGVPITPTPGVWVKRPVAHWLRSHAIDEALKSSDRSEDSGASTHTEVSFASLELLYNTCKSLLKVLKLDEDDQIVNPELAEILLPLPVGEYDIGYICELENTVEQLEPIISDSSNDEPDVRFMYESEL